MTSQFDHEKLKVYQKSLKFVKWLSCVEDDIPSSVAIRNQLDRASTSIPLNIAEGNGKWRSKDRCRFFDIAHGSALECAAALDIATVKELIEEQQAVTGKEFLQEIVNMLIGLIKANDPQRQFGKKEVSEGE